MTERIPCEFFLIRYVPDVVRGEFVNIGLVLRAAVASVDGRQRTLVRFTQDWRRVRCLDGGADLYLLRKLESEFADQLASEDGDEVKPLISHLIDTLSNSIQITNPQACLAEDMASEANRLMQMFVESSQSLLTRQNPRAEITFAMRSEFTAAGVWPLMQKRISAARYTVAGDPMKLDCGYRTAGVFRIFHAVPFRRDFATAKALALSAPQLHEGVNRTESCVLDLVAIVNPKYSSASLDDEASLSNEKSDRYRFGYELLDQERIRVVPLSGLPRLAETAKIELGFVLTGQTS